MRTDKLVATLYIFILITLLSLFIVIFNEKTGMAPTITTDSFTDEFDTIVSPWEGIPQKTR